MVNNFIAFGKTVHAQYAEMAKNELFVTNAENIFEKYLEAFPPDTNPIVKVRTEHDCQTCKQFIRRLGKLVTIKDGKVITVWDNYADLPTPYREVGEAMAKLVAAAEIVTVFRTKERRYGLDHNYGKDEIRHDHFWGEVVDRHFSLDPDTKRSEQDAIFQVCYRGLTEIKLDDLDTVLDLIENNQLYRGEEHKPALVGFQKLLRDFQAVPINNQKRFVWANLDNRNARFRNTVIGTLLTDLAQGVDIEVAVKAFESKVAPMNYKRPTTIITQKMIEQAVQTLTDLGLHGAIQRRYAQLSDISVNDVLFVDNDSRSKMKDGISLLLEGSVKASPPNLKNAIPIAAETFVKEVLPQAQKVELFLENRHTGNFVSLTGGDGPERLFKWNNNFAWSYDGDVTDSVKQRVKAAGGNINALFRVSLSWYNTDDLDLHCLTPDGHHIHYGAKMGILDVDMNAGYSLVRNPVENLAFTKLVDGVYKVWVNQYRQRETTDIGFAIEYEIGGRLEQYSYAKAVKLEVPCFNFTVKNGSLAKVEVGPGLVGGPVSQEKWGIKTATLVPVAAVMNSPNHWDAAGGTGAKHLIFALHGCKNPEPTRGIYNEFLRGDLDKHRKVFEVLGAKTKCAPTDDQVSGVGFTAARNDTVTVIVDKGGNRRSYTLSF